MRRLVAGAADATAEQVVAGLGLRLGSTGELPRVVAIMIASADGRATVGGTSRGLGHPEDRALLRGLRAEVDCVLVGTRTLRAERYRDLLDAGQRAARARHGRPEHPAVATSSRSGAIPWEVPVFSEPGVRKQVYVPAAVAPPDGVVGTEVHVLPSDGGLRAALGHLRAELGIGSVACEGGPALLGALLAEGLVDDLLLTLAPVVVAGDGPTAVMGAELRGPPRLALRDVHRADDHLFLHYAR